MSACAHSSAARATLRCAIYTRKSSEEGLEQAFNSLHAQREACEDYIRSQRAEGWHLLPDRYDDGGYSGGNLTRPGLQRLLEDVAARRVDVVVVYKVDRLTRSLADFARIVEALDARGASFVSITQQFNTTSSMGRLTLNVLLSFAQFEREVTGERIRDKIAASKRKGLWMGGRVPLGYELQDGRLIVQEQEAALVRHIFDCYLSLGSVTRLQTDLAGQGVHSKLRVSRGSGSTSGGCTYSRGALYRILSNPLYKGEIRSGKQSFTGAHEAIITHVTWNRVHSTLEANRRSARNPRPGGSANAALIGILQQQDGQLFKASRARRGSRLYTYYVLPRKPRESNPKSRPQSVSLPAFDLERAAWDQITKFLSHTPEALQQVSQPGDTAEITQELAACLPLLAQRWIATDHAGRGELLRQLGSRVLVQHSRIEILLRRGAVRRLLLHSEDLALQHSSLEFSKQDEVFRLPIPAKWKRFGRERRLVIPAIGSQAACGPDSADPMLKAIGRGLEFYARLVSGEAWSVASLVQQEGVGARYVGRILQCAFLAPDLVQSTLDDAKPSALTLDCLRSRLPACWRQQRDKFSENPKPSR